MVSPFPGVDPFIEGQEWEDFHSRFIQGISDALVPHVRPRYAVRVERRVYIEHDVDRPPRAMRPDVAIFGADPRQPMGDGDAATTTAIAPVPCILPMPEDRSETFLTIRDLHTTKVTTVIELLSPDNKRPGSDGRREYLEKRSSVLLSSSHLVEIDLLRGGRRMPTVDPPPPADFHVIVSRAGKRPAAELYPWTLRQPLPSIHVPLAGDDPDVPLSLQTVFTSAYDRAGYDYSLHYEWPLDPPLAEADQAWLRQIVPPPSK